MARIRAITTTHSTSRVVTHSALKTSLRMLSCPCTGSPKFQCSTMFEIQCQYWADQGRSSQRRCVFALDERLGRERVAPLQILQRIARRA